MKRYYKTNRICLWFLFLIFLCAIAADGLEGWTGEKTFGKNRDVPYVPTSPRIIAKMISMADVTDRDFVIDLGCGDGRIVIAAAKLGAQGIGIDIDPERIRECNMNALEEGVADRVAFFEQDLFKADISRASVLTMYLLPSVNLKLRPRLLTELKPGTRIVSHDFDLGEWEPDKRAPNVYFWIVPANVTGRWKLNTADMVLELNQKFQKVSGKLLLGDIEYPLNEASLEGSKLEFTISSPNPGRIVRYTCTFSGNDMQGKMESLALNGPLAVMAQREPGTRKRIDE